MEVKPYVFACCSTSHLSVQNKIIKVKVFSIVERGGLKTFLYLLFPLLRRHIGKSLHKFPFLIFKRHNKSIKAEQRYLFCSNKHKS